MLYLSSVLLLTLLATCRFVKSSPLSTGVETPAPENISVLEKRTESGPVLTSNFPDPSIIWASGYWYSFATTNGVVNIQIARSADFKTWTQVNNANGTQRDALPTIPAWVDGSTTNTWAPDVVMLDDGTFVMYYSATTLQSSAHHCVGAATSRTILGPYTPLPTELACPLPQGGAIDASGLRAGSLVTWGCARYLVYKVDGNSIGHGGICGNTVAPIVPTPIMLQQVAEWDGVTLIGPPVQILDNRGVADDGVVEAPSLVRSASGTYFLFFSSGCYSTTDYTVSYATASNPAGPYTRHSTPLFKTGTDGLLAPGGASVYGDAYHMVFHAGNASVSRELYTALLNIQGTTVTA